MGKYFDRKDLDEEWYLFGYQGATQYLIVFKVSLYNLNFILNYFALV